MLFLSKKCVSMSQCRLAYLNFCLQNHWAWLTDACCERESSHCCGYLPGRIVTPADHSATRWAPKIGVFLTPSLASWWKHCSPLRAKTSWQSWYKSFGC